MRNSAVRPLAIAALLSLAISASAQTQPPMPMMMPSVAPLYIEGHGFSSVLNLVNELKVPLNVTIEAYSLGGAQTATLMLTMAPYSLQQLTMAAVFGGAVPPEMGSIRVSPDHAAGLLGVLSLTHEGTNTSYFDEELAMPSTEGSSTYRGVADDAANGSPVAAITSLSSMPQKITVSCLLENSAAQQQTLELASNQTALVRPCAAGSSNVIADPSGLGNGAAADGANQPRKGAGIAVTSDAMPGGFAVYGLVPHQSDANLFFTSVNFSDPKARQASDSVYVGIPVGPSALLTAGSYAPEVSVTNFGLQPASVVLEALSTVNGKTLPATLASFPLAAGATKTVALADMAPSPGLTNGLLVHTDAQPGDVLSKLVSRGGSRLPVVEMLDKDEHGSHNAGGHPWSVAPGVTSTLLLFNGEPTPQKVNLRFGTAAGPWMKRYTLAPFETRAISINQLVEGPGIDDSGRALTTGALLGEFGWQADSTRVSGRVLESSPALGMARSFSCSQWIYACSFSFSPDPDLLLYLNNIGGLSEVPDWAVYTGFHPPTTCSCANSSSGNTTLYNSWAAGNYSIANITAGQTGTSSTWQGVGVGTTPITFSGNNLFLGGGSLMCAAAEPADVAPLIMFNGANVTNQSTNVVVGQKIALTASVTLPSGVTVKSQSWNVPGNVVANYVQSTALGLVTAYQPSTANQTTFYWIDQGTNKVTYSVKLSDGSGPFTANATFNVLRPTASFSSTTGSVKVCTSTCLASGPPELTFGDTTASGIKWSLTVTTPSGGAGNVALTQLVQSTRTQTLDPQGTVQTLTTGTNYVLDKYTQYNQDAVPFSANQTQTLTTNDSPGFILQSGIKHASVSTDSYETYLMYQPTGGIWVTLESMVWSWSGGATKSTGNIWTLDSGSSHSTNPDGSNDTKIPQWSSNITGYTFH